MKFSDILPTLTELDQKIQESENRVRRLEDEAAKERGILNRLIRAKIEGSYKKKDNDKELLK